MTDATTLTEKQAGLAAFVVLFISSRDTGTLHIEDPDGERHAFAFLNGVDVAVSTTLKPQAGARTPYRDDPAPSVARAGNDDALDLAEAIFARYSDESVVRADYDAEVKADETFVDAFDLLLRGMRAQKSPALTRSIEREGRSLSMHYASTLEAFTLLDAERKLVELLEGLPRSFKDLAERRLLPRDELAAFLYFLLITRNAFFMGDDDPMIRVPLGQLTFDERARRVKATEAPAHAARRAGYALFGLALAPLLLSLTSEWDIGAHIRQTLTGHPGLRPMFEQSDFTIEAFLNALPDGKIDGALLRYDSFAHWGFAGASAAFFLGVILFFFDRGRARRGELARVAAVTATVGVALVLLVRFLGNAFQGVWMRGGGFAMIIFYAIKAIDFSYSAALDPNNGLLLSFVGFTCGVGFLEELIKSFPVLDHFRTKGTLDARGAFVWGLASGAGFGVAEGVMYSAQYYNGLFPALPYLIRFTACVALHALWSAAAATAIYQRRAALQIPGVSFAKARAVLVALAAPTLLHGLYDTFLKRGMSGAALGVAAISVAYLALTALPAAAPAED